MGFTGAGSVRQRGALIMAPAPGWDARLYDGLRTRRIAPDVRSDLLSALGEVGVEAEFLLVLVETAPGVVKPTRGDGDLLLRRLTGSLNRLVDASATLEVATQGYLTALEVSYPEVSASRRDDVWWPPFAGYTLHGESLEARLRRCGFAWRHVAESRLPTHMEVVLEQLALTIFALGSLPPAGITPVSTLYAGLYSLSSALHGDIIPRHVLGGSGDPRYPGALASIERLRALDASGDSSLEADLAWARAQLASTGGATTQGVTRIDDARLLTAQAAYEWSQTVAFLEALRRRR